MTGRYFDEGSGPWLAQGFSVARVDRIDEAGMDKAAAAGATVVRVWADYDETGHLDVPAFARLRRAAERSGIRVIVALFSPSVLSDIYESPSRFEGGDTAFTGRGADAVDLIENGAVRDVVVDRCRQLAEVFADSPSLLAWEVANQVDDLYSVPTAKLAALIDQLAAAVRAVDEAHGVARLVCASSIQPSVPSWLLELGGLDLVAMHPYARSVQEPCDRISGAVHVRHAVHHALASVPRPMPVLDTESGIIGHLYERWIPRPPREFRDRLLHNLRWAHFSSGGAGSGLHVPINDEQHARPATRRPALAWYPSAAEHATMTAIAKFWAAAPATGPITHHPPNISAGTEEVLAFGSSTPGRRIGWLLRDTRRADLAADLEAAVAVGPTTPANLDCRLHAIDSLRQALLRHADLDPVDEAARRAVGKSLERGKPGMRDACDWIDDALDHLQTVAAVAAPGLLEPPTPGNRSVAVSVDGGPATIRWFGDTSGDLIEQQVVEGPDAVTVASPRFDRSIAYVIENAEEARRP